MRLHHLITFESPTEVTDAKGRRVQGWSAEFTTKAGYLRLRGSEAAVGARLQGNQPTVITVRNSLVSKRIGNDWRAVDNRTGETFNIKTSVQTDDRQYRELMAESGVSV